MTNVLSPLIIPVCRHILESGRFCQAAAVGKHKYCRVHLQLRTRYRNMARARRLVPPVEMPELFDMQAVQLGARRLAVAVSSRRIDQQTARLMNYGLQMSVSVLRLMDLQAHLNQIGSITYMKPPLIQELTRKTALKPLKTKEGVRDTLAKENRTTH